MKQRGHSVKRVNQSSYLMVVKMLLENSFYFLFTEPSYNRPEYNMLHSQREESLGLMCIFVVENLHIKNDTET